MCTSSHTKSTDEVAHCSWKKERWKGQVSYQGKTATPALRLILHPWDQTQWDTMFFPLQPDLCSEKSHPCGEMGWWEPTGLPTHFFFCSKTAECVSIRSPDKTTQDLRTGGFWLAKSILLWCHVAHNGMTMGMVIVLCLPQWNNMQLSIAKRRDNYAVPRVKTKLRLFGNSSRASITYKYWVQILIIQLTVWLLWLKLKCF